MVLLCPAQTVCGKGDAARLVSLTSCGDRWLGLWCGAVVWCGISSSSKKGKEKLRRHLLAEAGGQLRTPHTVNKKSLLFNFNDEKEEKENFGGSEAKRFCLEEYILSKNICAAF